MSNPIPIASQPSSEEEWFKQQVQIFAPYRFNKHEKTRILRLYRMSISFIALSDTNLMDKIRGTGCLVSLLILRSRHSYDECISDTYFINDSQGQNHSLAAVSHDLHYPLHFDDFPLYGSLSYPTTTSECMNPLSSCNISWYLSELTQSIQHKKQQTKQQRKCHQQQHHQSQSDSNQQHEQRDEPTNITFSIPSQYYFARQMRCVFPYPFTVNCSSKKRTIGLTLRELVNRELPSFHDGYFETALQQGRIALNSIPVISGRYYTSLPFPTTPYIDADTYTLQNGDVFMHYTHAHEPPVPDTTFSCYVPKRIYTDSIYQQYTNTMISTQQHIISSNILSNITPNVVASLFHEILVVNKPCGIPVHATGRYRLNTVLSIVERALYQKLYSEQASQTLQSLQTFSEPNMGDQAIISPQQPLISTSIKHHDITHHVTPRQLFVVHRLDVATSGLLLFACSQHAANIMSQLMQERTVQKHYLALVHGRFPMFLNTSHTADSAQNSSNHRESKSTSSDLHEDIIQLQRWGNGYWSNRDARYIVEDSTTFVPPCDGFPWSSNNQPSSFSPNSAHVLWNGIGVRLVASSLQWHHRESLSNITQETNIAQLEHPNAIEIVVDRPVMKHHMNAGSAVISDIGLNDNGNTGALHTPCLTKGDLHVWNSLDKYTDKQIASDASHSHDLLTIMNKSSYEIQQDIRSILTLQQQNENTMTFSGKPSLTIFRGLWYDPQTNTSLVHCMPKTGRTHQIRVHLAHIGFPIQNDIAYIPQSASAVCPSTHHRDISQPETKYFVNKHLYQRPSTDCSLSASSPSTTTLPSSPPPTTPPPPTTTTTTTTTTTALSSPSSSSYPPQTPLHSDPNSEKFYGQEFSHTPLIIAPTTQQEQSPCCNLSSSQLWEQSYQSTCQFCQNVDAGIWPEKRHVVTPKWPDSDQIQHCTQTTNPQPMCTASTESICCHVSVDVPVPVISQNETTITESRQIMCDTPHPCPITDPPCPLPASIVWKHGIPYHSDSMSISSAPTDVIAENVYPAVMSIDPLRESIYLHAMRYETKDWTFHVPAPAWAHWDDLHIPCSLYHEKLN